jgi:predicted  nucleic acid-binding Zn-ribbon protein
MLAKIAECIKCGEEYNYRRKELGYATCLGCGERSARRISARRTQDSLREMAPNSFTGSVDELFDERGKH